MTEPKPFNLEREASVIAASTGWFESESKKRGELYYAISAFGRRCQAESKHRIDRLKKRIKELKEDR